MNLATATLLGSLLVSEPAATATPPPAPEAEAKPPAEDPSAPMAQGPTTTPEEARKRGRGWNDRRRTVRGYFNNLGYNALRPFERPNWAAAAVGTGLAGMSTALDTEAADYFQENRMTTLADIGASAGGGAAVTALAVGLFSAGRIIPGDRFRSASYDASQAIAITSVYTLALKLATSRPRPDDSNDLSFPSGHASVAFAWATVAERHYGVKGAIPAYAAASAIAVSRLAKEKHYLSDIVAGATLGHIVGRAVVRGNSRPAAGVPAKPVAMIVLTLSHDGAGLGLHVSF